MAHSSVAPWPGEPLEQDDTETGISHESQAIFFRGD